MKDFFDSLRQQIGDRMSSPIFGSFIISWICWNHRYLFILFSALPVYERFTLAETLLYPGPWEYWTRFIIFPMVTSLVYILLYPWLSRPLLIYWDKRDQKLADLRNEAQKKTLLTKEESQKIILDALDQRTKFEEALQRQARENDALKKASINEETLRGLAEATDRIHALERELERERKASAPQNPLGSLDQDSQTGVKFLLKILSSAPDLRLRTSELKGKLGTSAIKAQVFLDHAISTEMVVRAGVPPVLIELTEKGRSFVVSERLDETSSGALAGLNVVPE